MQISIPSIGTVAWAQCVIPIAAFTAHGVQLGAAVWVDFEGDDLDLPVVLGLVDPPLRADALARDLEAMGDAWDRGHAAGTADADGGITPNPYR